MCRCPAHADKNPSLALRQGDRGILVTCFAGCERSDVLRELSRVPVGAQYRYEDKPSAGTGNAERLWNEALPIDEPLAARSLPSPHLLPVPCAGRFNPRCPYRPRPWPPFLPSTLVAVREGPETTGRARGREKEWVEW